MALGERRPDVGFCQLARQDVRARVAKGNRERIKGRTVENLVLVRLIRCDTGKWAHGSLPVPTLQESRHAGRGAEYLIRIQFELANQMVPFSGVLHGGLDVLGELFRFAAAAVYLHALKAFSGHVRAFFDMRKKPQLAARRRNPYLVVVFGPGDEQHAIAQALPRLGLAMIGDHDYADFGVPCGLEEFPASALVLVGVLSAHIQDGPEILIHTQRRPLGGALLHPLDALGVDRFQMGRFQPLQGCSGKAGNTGNEKKEACDPHSPIVDSGSVPKSFVFYENNSSTGRQ